jgi:hypothetical protein
VDVGPIGRTTVNSVSFSPFFPNHAKAQTYGSDPRNKLEELFRPPTIGAVCGNRISRSFRHERGLFPSIQASPSTESLRTRASNRRIKQPPQPMDRSLLDLQNPEKSSQSEPSRAVGVHGFAAHAPPLAAKSQQPPISSF